MGERFRQELLAAHWFQHGLGDRDARARRLVFWNLHGQGLTTFERAMDRDERLMAVLGSRMLEAQKARR